MFGILIFGRNGLFYEEENAELAYSNYARCDENLVPKIADFKADKVVNFNNLLKTCRLSLLSSMYDSRRVGKEFFPEGNKREDHTMWLNLLKKFQKESHCPKQWQNIEYSPIAYPERKAIL